MGLSANRQDIVRSKNEHILNPTLSVYLISVVTTPALVKSGNRTNEHSLSGLSSNCTPRGGLVPCYRTPSRFKLRDPEKKEKKKKIFRTSVQIAVGGPSKRATVSPVYQVTWDSWLGPVRASPYVFGSFRDMRLFFNAPFWIAGSPVGPDSILSSNRLVIFFCVTPHRSLDAAPESAGCSTVPASTVFVRTPYGISRFSSGSSLPDSNCCSELVWKGVMTPRTVGIDIGPSTSEVTHLNRPRPLYVP